MNLLATLSALRGLAASCLILGLLVASLPVTASTQIQSTGSQGHWSMKAPLPTARAEVGVAALDGRIYLLGGQSLGSPASKLNQECDSATDRWRDRAPLPRGMSHIGAVGFNGKLYALGGFTNNVHVRALDLAFEYDLATDTWRQLVPLSGPRGSVGVAVVDGKNHAIGGHGRNKVTVGTHEVYDPSTGKWSKAARLPTARDHMGIIVMGAPLTTPTTRICTTSTTRRRIPGTRPLRFRPREAVAQRPAIMG